MTHKENNEADQLRLIRMLVFVVNFVRGAKNERKPYITAVICKFYREDF